MVNIEELLEIADEYEHKYFDNIDDINPDIVGCIDLKNKVIIYNKNNNDKGITLCHELMHHYYYNIYNFEPSERVIENNAKKVYNKYKNNIDNYLKIKLK
jgi:hypothetical protein